MNDTGEPLPEQVKTNLLNWLDKYQDRGEIFFDFPYTPCFGQWEPNLIFPDDFVTDEEDPAGAPRPDPHYYQAAGQEVPPTEAQDGLKTALRALWHNKEFCLFLGALALFLVVMAFYPVN